MLPLRQFIPQSTEELQNMQEALITIDTFEHNCARREQIRFRLQLLNEVTEQGWLFYDEHDVLRHSFPGFGILTDDLYDLPF